MLFGFSGDGVKSFYQHRKRIYTHERCLQASIKKRKLFDHRGTVAHDQEASSNSISNSSEKGVCKDKCNSGIMLERGPLSYLLFENISVGVIYI